MSAKDDYSILVTLSESPLIEAGNQLAIQCANALEEIDKLREMHPCLGECFSPGNSPETWAELVAELKKEIKWRDGLIEMLKLKIKMKEVKSEYS